MKAITLTQPWAALVALGYKKIETRSWRTNYRGLLAIHSAKTFPNDAAIACLKEPIFSAIGGPHFELLKSHVLCTCQLVDVIQMTPEWIANVTEPERSFGLYEPGRYAWILEDVKLLDPPIKARGLQRLWNWEGSSNG